MSELVHYSRAGEVGVITVDNPPVNALSRAVRAGILEALEAGGEDAEAKALVLVCAGRTFIAGADIKEFTKPMEEPWLDAVIEALDASAKPTIAAIHGTALGGGLETALGCHYRVAVASAKLGLPEVHLGIIPGAGGTQRLPRVVGVEPALRMIASGIPVTASHAKSMGLVDALIEGELLEGALDFARKILEEKRGTRSVRALARPASDADVFAQMREEFARTKRGFEAPQRAIDAVEVATRTDLEKGLQKEKEIFLACLASPQSQAQRHLFFAERLAPKVADVPGDTPVREIQTAAVIGAGTMGGGIAMNFANAGIPVYLVDASQEGLDKGIGIIDKNYASGVKKGRMKEEQKQQLMELIRPTLDYDDLKEADIVIEAVFEEMDLKKEVFQKLDAVCKPGCILATNTSTLDINEIAGVTARPEQVIGLHFFSPANIMRLLEIVRGAKTDHSTIATSFALAKRIKKVAVLVGVCDGFVGNRMVHPYIREAMFLLEEGALPQQVDQAMTDFGFAMGPFAMSDLAGLDIGWRIRKRQAATRPAEERYAEIGDKICEMGRHGQKTGAGFYKYEGRTAIPDPEIDELVKQESARKGITRREFSDKDIVQRLVYALVNEGARVLEEGIAQRSSDIDVIYVYGYGFPAYRGGPMFHADVTGLKKVCEKVRELHAEHGSLWEPAPLLEQLAAQNGRFTDWTPS